MELKEKLKSQVIVADGAMGTLLDNSSMTSNKLWSAHALALYPDEISNIHRQYFEAGADIAITASYQASTPGFIESGVCDVKDEAKKLMAKSGDLAYDARTRADQLVAGSVGPYGAYLAKGQEYTGQYGNIDDNVLKVFHTDRLDALQDHCDLLAVETIPNFVELTVLMDMVRQRQKYCWVTLSIKDKNFMVDNTLISQAVKVIEANPYVLAVGFNCYPLDKCTDVLRTLRRLTPLPLVAYPNSGEVYDAEIKHWHSPPASQTLASQVRDWVDLGVRIVGGCCRTGPKDIAELRNAVDEINTSSITKL